ncbi:hypothetical protein [Oceanobacillus sp. AG]|uniref:hypothetical protein n=1 Tax=Oceanobacillus sp. AG TaxID=2681969 RepID=UPI0012ECADA2|nr:hypothetical protein [Oceanobacillus sp. AG]
MKHTLRAFSVGLITTGLILLAVFYLFGYGNESTAEDTTEELIEKIEEKGLRVISEEDYISFTLGNKEKNDDETDVAESDEEDAKESKEEKEKANDDKADGDKAAKEDKEKDKNKEKAADDKKKEKQKDEKPKKKDKNSPVVITVEPGMATSYISDILEEEGLIDDAASFNKYLIDNDYSLRVQMGKHELERGLSEYEIAERLTSN